LLYVASNAKWLIICQVCLFIILVTKFIYPSQDCRYYWCYKRYWLFPNFLIIRFMFLLASLTCVCVCVCVYIQKVINKQEKHQCNYKIYNHTYYLNLKSKLRELHYLCFLWRNCQIEFLFRFLYILLVQLLM